MPFALKVIRGTSAFAEEAAGAVFDSLFKAGALPRGALIATFFRLKFRRLWHERLWRNRLRRESLFGAEFDLRDHGAFSRMVREIFLRQIYLFSASHPAPRILDCGGNVGLATLFFKRHHPGARITVFEPDPGNFRLLDMNLSRAGFGDVERVPCALAASAGELAFRRDPEDGEGVNARLAPAREAPESGDFLVPAITLSSRIDGEIDFLKMDIEGAEDEVLREVAASGKLRHIARMTVEYHHHCRQGQDRLSAFLALLEDGGFGYSLIAGEGAGGPEGAQDILIQAYRKSP